MVEIWRRLEGYDKDYEISSFGRVKYHNYYKTKGCVEFVKCGTINSRGYKHILLLKGGKRVYMSIHRLVATAFLENPNNYPVINHKDENPSNNMVWNLEWCTQKHNSNWGNCKEKRSKSHSRPVVCYTPDGVAIQEYPSIKKATEALGIRECRIQANCSMRSLSCGGLIWGYKDRPDLLGKQINAFNNSKKPYLTRLGITRKKNQ